jgi:hypothetical protein
VRLEELGKLQKLNDLIGNQTCDLPACSTVPQSTMLLHAPFILETVINSVYEGAAVLTTYAIQISSSIIHHFSEIPLITGLCFSSIFD